MRRTLICAIPLVLASAQSVADTMRCGQSLLNEQTSVAELLKKCGEPLEKTTRTEEVMAVNAAGFRYKTGETTTREQWFYQRSPQSLRMVVTIVDGAIKSIERAE